MNSLILTYKFKGPLYRAVKYNKYERYAFFLGFCEPREKQKSAGEGIVRLALND